MCPSAGKGALLPPCAGRSSGGASSVTVGRRDRALDSCAGPIRAGRASTRRVLGPVEKAVTQFGWGALQGCCVLLGEAA